MKSILTVTDKAKDQIIKILKDAPFGTEGILLGINKGGCSGYSYKIDFAKKTDISNFDLIDKDGCKIFIEPKASLFLLGSEMDYAQDKLSSGFVFKNPNQKNTCGCGESFQI